MNSSDEIGAQANNDTFIFGTFMSLLWLCSLLFDLIIFLTIFLSRQLLCRVELLILAAIRIYALVLKLTVILVYAKIFLGAVLFGHSSQNGLQWALANICFISSLAIFYYSLYHLTFLNRSRLFIALSNLINKPSTFLAFSLVSIVVSATVGTGGVAILYPQIYDSNIFMNVTTAEFVGHTFSLQIVLVIVPSIAPSIVYILATVITCFTRLTANKTIDGDTKRFRKNLTLFSKFLILALMNMMSILPKTVYLFFVVFCLECSTDLFILNYLGDFCFIFNPFFLIYVHKILWKTFIRYFFKQPLQIVFSFFHR